MDNIICVQAIRAAAGAAFFHLSARYLGCEFKVLKYPNMPSDTATAFLGLGTMAAGTLVEHLPPCDRAENIIIRCIIAPSVSSSILSLASLAATKKFVQLSYRQAFILSLVTTTCHLAFRPLIELCSNYHKLNQKHEYEESISKVKEEQQIKFITQCEDLKQKYETEIEEKKSNQQEVTRLEEDYKRLLKKKNDKFDEENKQLKDLLKENQESTSTLQEKFSREIDELKENYRREKEESQEAMESLKQQHSLASKDLKQRYETQIEKERVDYESNEKRWQGEIASITRAKEEQQIKFKQEYDDLKEKYEKQIIKRTEEKQKCEDSILVITGNCSKQINELKENHRRENEEFQRKIASLEQENSVNEEPKETENKELKKDNKIKTKGKSWLSKKKNNKRQV